MKRPVTPTPATGDMFRALFEQAEVGIVFTALDGRIHPNPAYCEMLGYTESELRDRTYDEITHPDDRDQSHRMYARILAGPQHRGRWRKRYLKLDGGVLWTDVSIILEKDPDGRPVRFHTVVVDISTGVATETAASGANEVLEHLVEQRTAQLEASRGDLEAFSYSVSHDLRTPLRAVAGFGRLLEKRYGSELDETGAGYVTRIVDGADRMGGMIDDLLRFSRLGRQALSRQMIDPAVIARDALQDLEVEYGERHSQVVIEEMPMLNGDRALLHHVYLNLLSNALKFSATATTPRIVVGSAPGPDGVRIYNVSDNGTGFDMAYAHKLFGVFQRLHGRDEFEGNGVGLALVRAIIERHGGHVWAHGRPGEGATFSFTVGSPP